MAYFLVRVLNDHGAAYERDPEHPGGSESYTDFWQLARLSGVPTCEMKDIQVNSEDTYIFTPANGYTQALFSQPRTCKVIHWNIERPGIEIEPYVDEMWVSDRTQLLMASDPRVQYVPLGGHKDLGRYPTDRGWEPAYPKLWDLCPLCYAYGDRLGKLIDLATKGYTIAPSTFEPRERETILRHSRWGLMLHQTPHPIMTPLRAVLYACYKLPIVAELVGDSYPYKFIPFDEDLEVLRSYSEAEIQELVDFNYRVATEEFTFKACIEAAL